MENVKENFLKKYLRNLKSDRRTQIITIIILALLVLIIVAIFYFTSDKKLVFEDLLKQDKEEQEEIQNGRRLDGVIIDEGKENPYPVAVMIENISSVRPQSGLSQASIVYEALAEGGIPRFMAVFPGAGDIPKIGPVRSARAYYLEWQSEYNALYAFSGAYPPVLQAISGLDIKNINAMYNHQYYWRDNNKSAPHNLFTKSELLAYALRDKGLDNTEPVFNPWKFKDENELDKRPIEEKSITIDFSSAAYKVEYKYDRESNSYKRYNAGAVHSDANNGEQLSPKNVVIIKVPIEVIDNEGRLSMDVVGEGEAIMFSDGVEYSGIWKKNSRTERTMFFHEDGTEHEFTRGQTWVEVVPPDRNVQYN